MLAMDGPISDLKLAGSYTFRPRTLSARRLVQDLTAAYPTISPRFISRFIQQLLNGYALLRIDIHAQDDNSVDFAEGRGAEADVV